MSQEKDLQPITRKEKILDGQDLAPVTRLEYFLKKAATKGEGSGGGSITIVSPINEDTAPELPSGGEVSETYEYDLCGSLSWPGGSSSDSTFLACIVRSGPGGLSPTFIESDGLHCNPLNVVKNVGQYSFTRYAPGVSGNQYVLTLKTGKTPSLIAISDDNKTIVAVIVNPDDLEWVLEQAVH